MSLVYIRVMDRPFAAYDTDNLASQKPIQTDNVVLARVVAKVREQIKAKHELAVASLPSCFFDAVRQLIASIEEPGVRLHINFTYAEYYEAWEALMWEALMWDYRDNPNSTPPRPPGVSVRKFARLKRLALQHRNEMPNGTTWAVHAIFCNEDGETLHRTLVKFPPKELSAIQAALDVIAWA